MLVRGVKQGYTNPGRRGRLNFLIFVVPQHGTCFMALFWLLEFWGGPLDFFFNLWTSGVTRSRLFGRVLMRFRFSETQITRIFLFLNFEWQWSCLLLCVVTFWRSFWPRFSTKTKETRTECICLCAAFCRFVIFSESGKASHETTIYCKTLFLVFTRYVFRP